MKVFDEKGKLFGKINVIDLIVILLIIAAIVLVGVKVLGGDSADTTPDVSDSATSDTGKAAQLTYTVRVTAQREEVAEQLIRFVNPAEGKKEQLQNGGELVENAYVVDFWTEPCRYHVTSAGVVETFAAAEADAANLVNIYFVVEASVSDTLTNAVGAQEVRLGKSHIVKTEHLEFAHGFVTECDWELLAE